MKQYGLCSTIKIKVNPIPILMRCAHNSVFFIGGQMNSDMNTEINNLILLENTYFSICIDLFYTWMYYS